MYVCMYVCMYVMYVCMHVCNDMEHLMTRSWHHKIGRWFLRPVWNWRMAMMTPSRHKQLNYIELRLCKSRLTRVQRHALNGR